MRAVKRACFVRTHQCPIRNPYLNTALEAAIPLLDSYCAPRGFNWCFTSLMKNVASTLLRGRWTSAARWFPYQLRAHILQETLKFGRRHDDRSRCGAQAIDGLGRQYECRRLSIQIVPFRLVLQLRRTTRRLHRSRRPGRASRRRPQGPCWSSSRPSPGCGARSANASRCLSTVRPIRRNTGSIGVPAALSRISTVPGGVSDSSQLVGGEDCELTMKTTILRALSSGVGAPMSCSASRTSRASSTARMPTLSATPPSTRCR